MKDFRQGAHGHGKSLKVMDTENLFSRAWKVMENKQNPARSWKVMENGPECPFFFQERPFNLIWVLKILQLPGGFAPRTPEQVVVPSSYCHHGLLDYFSGGNPPSHPPMLMLDC